MLLQSPSVFCDKVGHHRLLRGIDNGLTYARMDYGASTERVLRRIILSQVYDHDPSSADAAGKLLLFKTPSDAYRIGIHAELFPNADIRYIHLTRGYAQAVNGLMDGWLSPVGFFAHDLGSAGFRLDIQGYSDHVPFGQRWWKFDLPSNWREFTAAPLPEVCLNQWMSCHRSIQDSGLPVLRIPFEELLANPAVIVEKIASFLGMTPMSTAPVLPTVMATAKPAPFRWLRREKLLMALGRRAEVAAMMQSLGYEMDPETWR